TSSFPVALSCAPYTLSLHDALPIWGDLLHFFYYFEFHHHVGAVVAVDGRNHVGGEAEFAYHYGQVFDGDVVFGVRKRNLGEHGRSEEHTSELQSRENLVCRLLLEKK